MFAPRLYLDGTQTLWALVKCDTCQDMHKYPAMEASRSTVKCKTCDCAIDVREPVVAAATAWTALPGEMRRDLSSTKRPTAR